jgi:hypothetical protein
LVGEGWVRHETVGREQDCKIPERGTEGRARLLTGQMRIEGISTSEGANQFLEDFWIPFWNQRFAIEPADPKDRHRPLPKEARPEVLFAETWTRVVTNDFTIRFVSDDVPMEIRWNGKREERRSYLSELLDIVNGTGRRISAVTKLRFADLSLERSASAPYGAIRWPGDTDKQGRDWVAPVSPAVRAALDRIVRNRPGIGDAPLFPSPEDPTMRSPGTWPTHGRSSWRGSSPTRAPSGTRTAGSGRRSESTSRPRTWPPQVAGGQ